MNELFGGDGISLFSKAGFGKIDDGYAHSYNQLIERLRTGLVSEKEISDLMNAIVTLKGEQRSLPGVAGGHVASASTGESGKQRKSNTEMAYIVDSIIKILLTEFNWFSVEGKYLSVLDRFEKFLKAIIAFDSSKITEIYSLILSNFKPKFDGVHQNYQILLGGKKFNNEAEISLFIKGLFQSHADALLDSNPGAYCPIKREEDERVLIELFGYHPAAKRLLP
eukprot:CAMPEP_0114987508 /NCGR_PEP_ID=MMETSP0216-20121206/9047_1 /TAXON_ID=223996 /ORGANISM="Protocruzia adherens, Strain Boccale" /LENGTH=222 /DNA_ID=CAMNT_0002350115 /DNA_START=321 /DNA_END=989 /DNA_ORIENTATION=+